MRRLLLCAMLIGAAPPADPQRPRVGVPIYGDDLGCSTASIFIPERPGELVAIRSGPSRHERVIARLRHEDPVFACVRRGDWFGIVFDQPGQRSDCDVRRPWPATERYPGPCRSGWVNDDHLAGYADWISP